MQGASKESKGKRMAIKFMNKLGTKEKFVRNVPGLGRLTHSQDSEVGTLVSSTNGCTQMQPAAACERRACNHQERSVMSGPGWLPSRPVLSGRLAYLLT